MPSGQAPEPSGPGQALALGLLGGSFNPVHSGHLAMARAAMVAGNLGEILFIPAAESPHKRGKALAAAEDRVAMLELALADEDKMSVATLELERGGVSWTIDTLRELARPGVQLSLILGSDNLPGLPTWKNIAEIFELAKPIVVLRSHEAAAQLTVAEKALGSTLGALLTAGFCEVEAHPGESSAIRAGLERGVMEEGMLPQAVRAYIERRGLYGDVAR